MTRLYDPASLVKAAAAGDAEAWNTLVDRYSGLVWSIARSYRLGQADAADVSQMVWLELVEHLGTLRCPERVGAWLASVTRHECLRLLRRAGREAPVADADLPEVAAAGREVEEALITAEHRSAVRRAIEGLPPLPRSVMRMLLTEPCPTYEQVAATLGIAAGTVGPTRRRAMRALSRSPHLSTLGLGAAAVPSPAT